MKLKKWVLIVLAIAVMAVSASARTALGVMIGEPTGLSLRMDRFPILGVAWSFRSDYMHVHCDYWLINKTLNAPLRWYLGLGAAVGVRTEVGLAARVPLGLQIVPHRHIEIFGELVPGVAVLPGTDVYIAGALGVRYIF